MISAVLQDRFQDICHICDLLHIYHYRGNMFDMATFKIVFLNLTIVTKINHIFGV